MATVRLTPTNLASLVADWAASDTHRDDTLAFRGSAMSADDVRSACWDAGVVASVDSVDGDLYRVTFVDVLVERT